MTSLTLSIGPCGAKWPETFHLAWDVDYIIFHPRFLSFWFAIFPRFPYKQQVLEPIDVASNSLKMERWPANPSPSSEVGRSPSFLCRWPILRTRDLDKEILTHYWCPSWSEAFNPTTCVHWNVCAVNLVAFVQFKYLSRGCCPSVSHPFTPLF